MKKSFHLAAVLAVYTGLLVHRRYFDELQQLSDAFPGDRAVKKARLLEQFSWLPAADDDISPDERALIRAQANEEAIKNILESWLCRQVAEHGERLEVEV